MYSRKTLLIGVIVHSADLLMCSDILIVLIFAFYLIFRPYLYYATLHILYINSCILASGKIVSELYFEISFTHIYIKVFTPKFYSVFHRAVVINS